MATTFILLGVLMIFLCGASATLLAQQDTTQPIDFVHIAETENLDLSKGLTARVSANPTAGFSFPYYLFVPQEMDSSNPVYLLVEPCNTGTTSDDFEHHDSKAKSLALKKSSHANKIARELGVPLLVPVFPRPGGEQWRIYTHALDRDTLLVKEGDLRRIDEQLIQMITHAQRLLRHNNVKVNEQVFMNGFSASGTFTNRFAILHPKVVRAVATGGVNCLPTLPTDRWNGTTMRYPVGIADVKEIAGIDFDEVAYKRVSQYIYMGALDNNDTVPYRDGYDEVDAELVKTLIGAKMMPNRWDMSQSIYKALEIPAQFVTYENTRHEIRREMIDDVVAFFRANSDAEIVEINPYQYSDERNIVLSANAATENGQHLAEGTVTLKETDTALTAASYGTVGMGKGDPSPQYMLISYLVHHRTDLFRFPLVVGDTWTQDGKWDSQMETTLEGYEAVEVSSDLFTICLKHKTVFTGADAGSEQRNSLVNGTRYLWFAKGVGLVKMRYEHSNGVITEAELLKYELPVEEQEYLPLQVGNMWKYKWQNDYRDEAVIETCHVVSNFEKPEGLDNPVVLASARYEVKIDADDLRVAHVRCVLTPKQNSDETLSLSMSEFGTEGVHDGYGRYLRDLTVTDAGGETLPIAMLGKTRWAVKVTDNSPVILSYKVLLNHDEREWPPGRDEVPYVQEDCIFCPGYALFVVGEVNDIQLHVDVPENWHVSTPWYRIGDKGHRFAVKDQNDLMYAYMVLGTHSEKVAKSNEAEMVLAIGGSFKAAAAEIQSTVEALLQAYSGVFGGTPKSKMLFVANPYGGKGETRGGVSGHSISTLMGGPLDKANRNLWVPLVAHELCHIWNGTAIKFFDEREYWFMEGFTDYYSEIVSVRLGLLSESDFLKNLGRAYESYLGQVGTLSIRDAGSDKMANSGLVYSGGGLVAALLDVKIRKLTQGQKSLDNVMKRMYREFGITDETYTIDDVIRIVSDVAGADFEPFFRKYVSGTERLPLAEYFGEVGLDVQIEEELPDLGYVLKEMLRIRGGLTQSPVGALVIHKSPEYRDGDILVAINGTPVNAFNDVAKLSKDWKSGDVVELTVERNGEEIVLPVTLGGTSEEPPLEVGIFDVNITKRTDSTDSQRAILTGILGDGQ